MSTQNENVEAQDNLRYVPVGEFLKLKKDSFLLYCVLQQDSYRNPYEQHRFFYQEDINYAYLRRKTGIKDLRTIKNKFEQLLVDGFIVKKVGKDEKVFYVLPCVSDYYVLVNFKIREIKAIMKLCDENLLRVYLFHKSYSLSYKNREYRVTRDYICRCIGLSDKSSNNLRLVTDCHDALCGFGILKITKKWEQENGKRICRNFYKYTGIK